MSGKLTFGYLYDFRNPAQWRRPWAELYAEILDFVAYSESLGFDGAWVPEHHGASDGYMPAPLIALAAIAARTRRIKLGSAIALAPLHHPVRFAEECAVLDHLSNGRLEMAVAIGYRRREAEAYGVDFGKRGSRTDEFLEIVTRLWRAETVSFEGRHFQIRNASIAQARRAGAYRCFWAGSTKRPSNARPATATVTSATSTSSISISTSCARRARTAAAGASASRACSRWSRTTRPRR